MDKLTEYFSDAPFNDLEFLLKQLSDLTIYKNEKSREFTHKLFALTYYLGSQVGDMKTLRVHTSPRRLRTGYKRKLGKRFWFLLFGIFLGTRNARGSFRHYLLKEDYLLTLKLFNRLIAKATIKRLLIDKRKMPDEKLYYLKMFKYMEKEFSSLLLVAAREIVDKKKTWKM